MEIKFNPCEKLNLNNDEQNKVRKILSYLVRELPIVVTAIFNERVQFNVPYMYGHVTTMKNCTSVEYCSMAELIYVHFGEAFNLGEVNIDVKDYKTLLEIYYQKCLELTKSEEKSEAIPINKIYTYET